MTPNGTRSARVTVAARRQAGQFVPGLGHPVHKAGDRARPCCWHWRVRHDVFGPHLALFEAIGRVHPEVLGKTLPLNGAGVCGAALADIEIPLGVVRGVALLARCAGSISDTWPRRRATRSRSTCT